VYYPGNTGEIAAMTKSLKLKIPLRLKKSVQTSDLPDISKEMQNSAASVQQKSFQLLAANSRTYRGSNRPT